MAKELDKSKDFGTIGGVFGVAKFEQDGEYFDAQGKLLDGEGNPLKGAKTADAGNKPAAKPAPKGGKGKKAEPAEPVKAPAEPVATTEADAQLAAQLGG
jgi:hypothetical protein